MLNCLSNVSTIYRLNDSKLWYLYKNMIAFNQERVTMDSNKIKQLQSHPRWGIYCNSKEINLKYVPAKVKNANYATFGDYIEACINFLNQRKEKAKTKLEIKKHNIKCNAAIDFMGLKENCCEILKSNNFKETWNYPRGFRIDYKLSTNKKIMVEQNTVGTATIHVKGIKPDKLETVLKQVIDAMQKQPA